MTEEEWLARDDLGSMIGFIQDKGSDRKWRLFAVGCCRRIWQHLHAATGHRLAELVEASRDAEKYVESDEGRWTETSCSAAYAATSIIEDYPGERAVWLASR